MAEKDHPHAAHISWGGISKNEVALPSLGHFPQESLFYPEKKHGFYTCGQEETQQLFPTRPTVIQASFQTSPNVSKEANKCVFGDQPWTNIFLYKCAVKP